MHHAVWAKIRESGTHDRLSVLGEGEHYDLHKPRNCTGSHLSLRRNTRIAAALTEAEDTHSPTEA